MSHWKDELRARAVTALARHRREPKWLEAVNAPAEVEALHGELELQRLELELQQEQLRQSQLELEESRDRYRALFNAAPVAYLELDADGSILDANRKAEELLGDERAGLLGTRLARFVAPERAIDFELHCREVIGGSPASDELPFMCRGNEKIVQLESAPHDDRSSRWRCALIDRTAQRALEAQVAQAQKLEAVAVAASGIAHDFNNLLFGISGCADVAIQIAGEHSPVRRPLERLKKAVASGASMVRDLFVHSRTDARQREIFDLHEVLCHAERMLRQVAGTEVELTLELDGGDALIDGDPVQLEQVLLNLVINARQAMPVGGQVRIATAIVELEPARARALGLAHCEHVALTVTDTGVGMDEHTKRRAFEPFFTTKPKGVGTGLGLPTVYSIVKRLGGHIELDSEPGRGSTFRILMPLASGPRSAPPLSRAEAPRAGAPATVLVVEDEQLARQATGHYLESIGHRVLLAASRVEALEHCLRMAQEIDVVVMDVVLKDGVGTRVAEEIVAICPDVVTVFMSAHPIERLREQGVAPPGRALLLKPFDGERLQHIVARAAALSPRHRSAGPTIVVVAEDVAASERCRRRLREAHFEVLLLDGPEDAFPASETEPALAIIDASNPQASTLLMARLRAVWQQLPILLLSASPGDELDAHAGSVAVLARPADLGPLPGLVRTLIAQYGGDLDWLRSAENGSSPA